MKYLLTTVGSAGDVFPMVGLATELKRRGHDVTLMTNGYFESLARRHELGFMALGTAEQYRTALQSPELWEPTKAFAHVFKYFKTIIRQQHEAVVASAQAEPTVVLASCLSFGARVAQESHGVPVFTVHLQPAVIWSDFAPPVIGGLGGPLWFKRIMYRIGERLAVDRIVCPELNPWRATFGLRPMRRVTRWWNSPTGVVCLFPEWFAPPQQDWPQPLIQTDFPLWNDETEVTSSETLDAFLDAGDPPLVFTPGTANVHGKKFFEAAIQTCQNLRRRGILLTRYPEQLPARLPDGICHVSYAPLDQVLARAAAFIHHGGVGSTSQGLLAGIPQVAMPLAHDQFDNGARIERLNVGGSLPAPKFNAPRLTKMLAPLLESSDVAAACQKVRDRLLPRNGLSQTVDAIESRVPGLFE